MFTEKRKPRGRPPGRTEQGDAMRQRIFAEAIAMIESTGYERATLRDVASRVGVSPALLYRYFPSKRAVLVELYQQLSAVFAERTQSMPEGLWRERFLYALRASLEVLGPHRAALRALTPLLVADADDGVLSPAMSFSRERVSASFVRTATDAKDAPGAWSPVLGRLLYLLHLVVILFWLLDRSAEQKATQSLFALLERSLPALSLVLRVSPLRSALSELDALVAEALIPPTPRAGIR